MQRIQIKLILLQSSSCWHLKEYKYEQTNSSQRNVLENHYNNANVTSIMLSYTIGFYTADSERHNPTILSQLGATRLNPNTT